MRPLLNFICIGHRETWPDVFTVTHFSAHAAPVDSTVYRRQGESDESLWARLLVEVDRLYRHEGRTDCQAIVFFDYDTTPAAAALVDDELVNFQRAIRRMAKRDRSATVRAYAQQVWANWILEAKVCTQEERGLLQ